LVVIAFFAQTFGTFFLTDHDPVLVAVERFKANAGEAGATKNAAQNDGATHLESGAPSDVSGVD